MAVALDDHPIDLMQALYQNQLLKPPLKVLINVLTAFGLFPAGHLHEAWSTVPSHLSTSSVL